MKRNILWVFVLTTFLAVSAKSWAMAKRPVDPQTDAVTKSLQDSQKEIKEQDGNKGSLYHKETIDGSYLKELEREKARKRKQIEQEQKNILKNYPKGKTVIGL